MRASRAPHQICMSFARRLTLSSSFRYLAEGLVRNKSLKSLKIGRNMKQKTKYRGQAIKNVIACVFNAAPPPASAIADYLVAC